jgi:hypothetical protein
MADWSSRKKKHLVIIWGYYLFQLHQDGPLHWTLVISESLPTFQDWLPCENYNKGEFLW